MKPVHALLVSAVGTILAATSASATIHNFSAILTQAQEVPAPTPVAGAIGMASVRYNDATNMLNWGISYWGLSGPATGIHLHGPAGAGVAAGVRVDIGSMSGLVSPAIGSAPISADLGNELLNDLWYANIHTSLNPGGEIRGDLRRAGSSQMNPVIPDNPNGTSPGRGTWVFTNADGTGQWFDPIAANGFLFETDGASNFTSLILPNIVPDNNGYYIVTSIHGSTNVPVGGLYNFPTPVDTFTITDIDPSVDGENPVAFPTFLLFDQPVVSFTMTPIVPEPGTAFAMASLALLARRRR